MGRGVTGIHSLDVVTALMAKLNALTRDVSSLKNQVQRTHPLTPDRLSMIEEALFNFMNTVNMIIQDQTNQFQNVKIYLQSLDSQMRNMETKLGQIAQATCRT